MQQSPFEDYLCKNADKTLTLVNIRAGEALETEKHKMARKTKSQKLIWKHQSKSSQNNDQMKVSFFC